LSQDKNLGQTEAKLEPNLGHALQESVERASLSQDKNLGQTESKLEPKLGSPKEGGQVLAVDQSGIPLEGSTFVFQSPISSLVGLQLKILLYLKSNIIHGSKLETPPISIRDIVSFSNTTSFSARKAIQRLINKGLLYRAEVKEGRGGWTRYGISQPIYQAIVVSTLKES
jgi:hypothetical protein